MSAVHAVLFLCLTILYPGWATLPQDTSTLSAGKPVEREIAGAQAHEYQIQVAAGDFLRVIIERRNLYLAVSFEGPDGESLFGVDVPNGAQGPAQIWLIADKTGLFKLRVSAPEGKAAQGKYLARIEALRPATAEDRKRVQALDARAEADNILAKQTADSLKQAIGKHEVALGLYRELGDQDAQAEALTRIGDLHRFNAENTTALQNYQEALQLYGTLGDKVAEADNLLRTGIVYYALGDRRKALESYEQALPAFRAAGDKNGEASALINIGRVHGVLGAPKQALESYEQALAIFRAIGSQSGETAVMLAKGQVLSQLGDLANALACLETAQQLAEKQGNLRISTSASIGMAAIYALQGDRQRALDIRLTGAQALHRLGDRLGEAATLNDIGTTYVDLADLAKALEYFGQALQLQLAIGDRHNQAVTLANMGNAYLNLGDAQKAVQNYKQALTIQREIGERRGEGATLNSIGQGYLALGEPQKALDAFESALRIARAFGSKQGEASVLINIAAVYGDLGDRERALGMLEQTLPLSRAAGDREAEANSLNNMGALYGDLGQPEKAADCYAQALSIGRAIGDRTMESAVLINRGSLYKDSGDLKKALASYQEALAIARELGTRDREATALHNLATTYEAAGKSQEALQFYRDCLALQHGLGNLFGEANTRFSLGEMECKAGDVDQGRADMQAALTALESFRSSVASPELRASFLGSMHHRYSAYIDVLMKEHRLKPHMVLDASALEVAERGRARSLAEILHEARADVRQGVSPELLERERVLSRALDVKSAQLIRLGGNQRTPTQVDRLKAEIDQLERDYRQAQTEIRTASPRYAALTQPQPITAKEIQQQMLDADTLLLEYALGKEQSYLWVVSRNSVRSFELASSEHIEAAARRFYQALTERNRVQREETAEQQNARVAKAAAACPEAAAGLSRLILAPAASLLARKRLLIVADGVLQLIPFPALAEPGPGSYTPLLTAHEVVSLPSASVLATLRLETADRKQAPKSVAVLADPVFDNGDPRVAAVNAAVPPDHALERAAIDAGALTEGLKLPRLVFTRQEAEDIISLLARDEGRKALDFEASIQTASGSEISQYRIVHFATHGLLDTQRPSLSGLVLSLVDQKGLPQDGFLKLKDVYNLNLPAELVVLSACQTALGKEIRGEGLIGLTRGFMYAGALRVVSSLWKVDDVATAELMKRFYHAMLIEKERPAAALRKAQMEIWRQRRWSSPYYWAAFTLQGEWK